MEQKKKHRKVLRTAFTKGARELGDLLATPEVEVRLVKVSLNILQQKHEDIKLADSEIYTLMLEEDASEEDLLAEMEGSDNYSRRFADLNLRCEEWMEPVADNEAESTASRNISVTSRAGRRKFKLPTLEFKRFDGNIRDWLPFWSQFKKVDDDPDIDLNDKVEYLIQATVPGSRARQLVDSFPATGNNYSKMIDSLTARFGRVDLQIEVYVRELLKLILDNATSGAKMELSLLYDKIETQLRALETLGITSDKYAAMLFPLIESCFPSDLLRVWQRIPFAPGSQNQVNTLGGSTLEDRLKSLMSFLKNEVDNEQHVSLAVEGFGLRPTMGDKELNRNPGTRQRFKKDFVPENPTAIGLLNCDVAKCVFCQGSHESTNCFKAQKFDWEEKRNILSGKGACFRCLKLGHQARKCRGRLKCMVCGKSHVTLMCPDLATSKQGNKLPQHKEKDSGNSQSAGVDQALTNRTSTEVFLQTLRVKMESETGSRMVRALIDTGSQKTYVLKSTAQILGYAAKHRLSIAHGLFGGSEILQRHDCYDVNLRQGSYSCTFEALDQTVICTEVPTIVDGIWTKELEKLNIKISDSKGQAPIEILIGSDIAGRLYTGKRYVLECGLVAVETLLGWTLMGKIPLEKSNSLSMTSVSLFVRNATISDLWDLEALGITDPTDKKTREEMAMAAKELFSETITTTADGRYEVSLPWLGGHPALPSNYHIAKKRLDTTVAKLKNEGYLELYHQVFQEWLNENIIEEVPQEQLSDGAHYLPHRPVIKHGSATTKIRPVFDASAKEKDHPSLNQCLEKGLNLIELIPAILLRFRQSKIGVISDIRKAFLQISIHEADRDFLRFLWIDPGGDLKVYRHRRVVFGISSSPFLLGATMEYHLSQMLKKCASEDILSYSRETLGKLMKSFYVDNCVTSVPNEEELRSFIRESSVIMAIGKFDLRGWEYSHQIQESASDPSTLVLGINWDKVNDTLSINQETGDMDEILSKPVTKRLMLSLTQRVFDPVGFTCPATLRPKLLLQQTWSKGLSWDAPVDLETETNFRKWLRELPHLSSIKIPRWINAGPNEADEWSIHTFCDASKDAYSAVIFLRGVQNGRVFLHLLAAKSRVAPLRELSIPRLELMAAVIAVRLYTAIKESLDITVESFFWSDSSTVLSWIRRSEEWATFVWNRVTEIRKTTASENWRHVPGTLNPADLPSRGCSPKQLLESKWWEGPSWLYQDSFSWPQDHFHYDEEEVNREKRSKLVTVLINTERSRMTSDDWHLNYFSQYQKTIRMVAWIFRFVHNSRSSNDRRRGYLTSEEVDKAEIFVFTFVQSESFKDENDKQLRTLDVFRGNDGLLRLKSRASNRDDLEHFRFPIVLPAKLPLVKRLIFREHCKSCHVSTQGLMNILREFYWILGGRRAIKSAISGCVVCKRHNAKPFQAEAPSLPIDRVRDAVAFEITGVDFAGPLYLKTGQKTWICLFTCAVYRAVHLELCTSLSVVNFMLALRRFIARRGRPKTIYSDNGTNFVGTENAFSRLDFRNIAEHSCAERIKWRFNPPTAAWWGGFWERLVGMLKQLLRKVLGRASLDYENLATVMCDCESIINSRPITYTSSDANELTPLTPVMFLRDQAEDGVPDCDAVDKAALCRKIVHRRKLVEDLRRRFRIEYLGQLQLWHKRSGGRKIRGGELVLIGNDQDKRLRWPIGRVAELLPGKDGQVRLVKVVTERGQLLRPIQRLYPLECVGDINNHEEDPCARTKRETSGPHDAPASTPRNTSDGGTRLPSDKVTECSGGKNAAESGVFKSRVSEPTVYVTRSGRIVKSPKRFADIFHN